MKKSLLLFYIFAFQLFSLKAQNWDWVKNYNPGAIDAGTSIGIDKENNIYITGNSHYFGGGGNSNYTEMFWKLDSIGNTVWTQTLDIIQSKTVTDTIGNTYITGGNKVAKYNSSGQQLWQTTFPMLGLFLSIAQYPSDGIVLLGRALFNDSSKTVLSRYDKNGSCLWTKIGTFPLANKITCDKYGNIYIVGTGSKDTTTINFGLLTKCDSNGNLIYSRTIPATATDIAIDTKNNIYITGWFSIFGINLNGIIYSGDHTKEFQFLIKYEQGGNVLWHKVYTGRSAIDVDEKDNLVVTLNYYINKIDQIDAPFGNLLVFKTDSIGNIIWFVNSLQSNPLGEVQPCAIGLKNDKIFVTGWITGKNILGNYILSSNMSYSDMFVAKISQPKDVSVPELKKNENNLNFNVFPNPTGGIFQINCSISEKCKLQINITDTKGQKIYSETIAAFQGEYNKSIDLSKQSKGVYFIEIFVDRKRAVKKIVVN